MNITLLKLLLRCGLVSFLFFQGSVSANENAAVAQAEELTIDQAMKTPGVWRPVEAVPLGDVTPQIVGGGESPLGARPYQVAFMYDGQQGCGGALIARKWVLTAAHCLFDYNGDPDTSVRTIWVGVRDLKSNEGQVISIAKEIIHPKYQPKNPNTKNDIALIKLSRMAPSGLTPLKLPKRRALKNLVFPGSMLTVSGWGNRKQSPNRYPNILHEVDVPVVSNAVCNQRAAYDGDVARSELCAGYAEGGKDSCDGDSGGPLAGEYAGNYYSIGVVSWGQGCAKRNKYGVYTRTSSFVKWILSSMHAN